MTQGDEFEVILLAITQALHDQHQIELTSAEQHLLAGLWQQPSATYSEIAAVLSDRGIRKINGPSLRNVGSKLYRNLSILTGVKLDKRSLIERLQQWFQHYQAQDSLDLVGRLEDITRLTQHIENGAYRVICVVGVPRIGKTDLVQAAITILRQQAIANHTVAYTPRWIEAENAQTVEHLYHEVHQQLHASRPSETGIENAIAALMNELRRQPMLLIVNDADILYDPLETAGVLREGSGYQRLLRYMVNDPTLEGRLIWVSRVPPRPLEMTRNTLCKHELPPLTNDEAIALLNRHQLLESDSVARQHLIEFCGANPGLLLEAAFKVRDTCSGEVSKYVANPQQYLGPEGEHWRQAIATLSEAEQVLLAWLLLKPWSYEAIMDLVIPQVSSTQRVQALESLRKRGFLQENDNRYHLDPPFLQYLAAAELAAMVSQLILERQSLERLRYPIILPLAAAWRRQWHRQYILEPLSQHIRDHSAYWNQAAQQRLIEDLVSELQSQAQQSEPSDYGYALGILLSLAAFLKLPLTGLALAQSVIRYADLRAADLSGLSIDQCQFYETDFPVCLSGKLVADMSADGTAIAVGDGDGRVGYWIKAGESYRLQKYHRFRNLPGHSVAIQAISIHPYDVVVVAVGTTIYRWWTGGDAAPMPQLEVDCAVRCLAQNDDYIAVGLQDGGICVHDRITPFTGHCRTHTGPISVLTFDADGFELASIGHGNRLLCWDLETEPMPAIQDNLPSSGRILYAARWYDGELIVAGTKDGAPTVKRGEAAWMTLQSMQSIGKLAFSSDGSFLAGLDRQGRFYLWNHDLEEVRHLHMLKNCPDQISISNDGSQLLTINRQQTATQIQLWCVDSGRLVWDLSASQQMISALTLTEIKGIAEAELLHFSEFTA